MKISLFAPALILIASAAGLRSPQPREPRSIKDQPQAGIVPSPTDRGAADTLNIQVTPNPAARGMDYGRPGDASGFQNQRPVTAVGVDPNTGKMPERQFNGLRFGTSVDDLQRMGPRAR